MSDIQYTSRTINGKEILFRSHEGKLNAEIEIEMMQYAVDKGLITENVVGMVLNMISAKFEMEMGEGNKIVDYCSKDARLADLKYAIIVDTPDKIIHPLIGGIHMASHKLRPFSTEEAAIHWMLTS